MFSAVPAFDLDPEAGAVQRLRQMDMTVGDAFRTLDRFAIDLIAGGIRQPDPDEARVAEAPRGDLGKGVGIGAGADGRQVGFQEAGNRYRADLERPGRLGSKACALVAEALGTQHQHRAGEDAGKPQPKSIRPEAAFELHRVGDAVSSRNIHALKQRARRCAAAP